MAELLLELLSEEIPARMQARAAEDLRRLVGDALKAADLAVTRLETFVTPRRLTLVADGLPLAQPDRVEERKGPKVGAPDKAVEGFLRAAGLTSLDQCEKRGDGKGEFWVATRSIAGRATATVLPEIVNAAIAGIPWPKSMRWADAPTRYVRPLQGVIALFDGKPLDGGFLIGGSVGTLPFGRETRGHRFLSAGTIAVDGFDDYKARLRAAHVMLDPAERRQVITDGLAAAAKAEGLVPKPDDGLMAEVMGLVEWPVVLLGRIDDAFMDVPAEVLTTSMRTHQKYFALLNADGSLAPRFAVVANNVAADGGKTIIAGNERVLRARLSDAKFFWDQDRKLTLESRVPALDGIVFHAKLGSLGAKVRRMATLAGEIAAFVPGCDADLARQAATLAKADLVAGMVGEFPELQGIMGRYYARHEGLPEAVGIAIGDHYAPQGPGDRCPSDPVAIAVSLADKLDTLVGFFAIDEKPTGSRDPFALRRAALGVIRIVLENRLRLPLREVMLKAYWSFPETVPTFEAALPKGHQPKLLAQDLLGFFADRLEVHLRERGVRHDLVRAVFALGKDDDLVRLLARVDALAGFVASEDGRNLLIGYRRARNILAIEEKKDGATYREAPDPAALAEPAERQLVAALDAAQPAVMQAIEADAFPQAMSTLAGLRPPIDAFFETVKVNADDATIRANRLRLLSRIPAVFDTVADVSLVEG